VSVPNPHGLASPGAVVAVRARNAFSYELIPSEFEKGPAFFDGATSTLWMLDLAGRLVRMRLGSGGWTTDAVTRPYAVDLGPSLDGRRVFVKESAGPNDPGPAVAGIDVETLEQVSRTHWLGSPYDLVGVHDRRGGQLTADGRLWFSSAYSRDLGFYDTLSDAFGVVEPRLFVSPPSFAASGDRRALLVSGSARYDAATGLSTACSLGGFHLSLSGDGGLALADGVLHAWTGAAWSPRGEARLTEPLSDTAPAVVSPGGSRVYRLVRDGDLKQSKIAVFDAQATAPAGALPRLGEIPIPVPVSWCAGPYSCTFDPVLLVAPFGDALFLVGNQAVMVLPIPVGLQGGG
jgi:hypothetical protein